MDRDRQTDKAPKRTEVAMHLITHLCIAANPSLGRKVTMDFITQCTPLNTYNVNSA